MPKTKNIQELTTILAIALRHKIGGIVNQDEIYAQKYAKDGDVLIKEAKKIFLKENWNNYDKEKIKKVLKKKLQHELEKREFLDNKKFDIMEREMDKTLESIGLN